MLIIINLFMEWKIALLILTCRFKLEEKKKKNTYNELRRKF